MARQSYDGTMIQLTHLQKRCLQLASLVGSAVFVLFALPYFSHTANAAADDPLPHAPLPAYVYNYPKPTVTVDTTQAPDLDAWMTTKVVPLLRDWYPVLADNIVGAPKADYPLVSSFTLQASSTYTGYMQVNPGNVIIFNADAIRNNQSGAFGGFIHELTHVVHQGKSSPYWVTEGMADYARAHIYADYSVPMTPNQTYLNGYMPSAHFIDYINSVSPNFVSKLAYTSSRPVGTTGYKASTIQTLTGKSTETHWLNYTGHTITPISNFKPGNATTKCIDLPGFATADGTIPDIWTCGTGDNLKWVFRDKATGGFIQGYYGVKCLTASSRLDRLSNRAVTSQPCDSTNAYQKFVHRADTAIYNTVTGSCLMPTGNGTANGTALVAKACSSSLVSGQKWTLTATP
jgi:Ricin-type beta-trefoil lectin domain/Peptidase of plants and bacteria